MGLKTITHGSFILIGAFLRAIIALTIILFGTAVLLVVVALGSIVLVRAIVQ